MAKVLLQANLLMPVIGPKFHLDPDSSFLMQKTYLPIESKLRSGLPAALSQFPNRSWVTCKSKVFFDS